MVSNRGHVPARERAKSPLGEVDHNRRPTRMVPTSYTKYFADGDDPDDTEESPEESGDTSNDEDGGSRNTRRQCRLARRHGSSKVASGKASQQAVVRRSSRLSVPAVALPPYKNGAGNAQAQKQKQQRTDSQDGDHGAEGDSEIGDEQHKHGRGNGSRRAASSGEHADEEDGDEGEDDDGEEHEDDADSDVEVVDSPQGGARPEGRAAQSRKRLTVDKQQLGQVRHKTLREQQPQEAGPSGLAVQRASTRLLTHQQQPVGTGVRIQPHSDGSDGELAASKGEGEAASDRTGETANGVASSDSGGSADAGDESDQEHGGKGRGAGSKSRGQEPAANGRVTRASLRAAAVGHDGDVRMRDRDGGGGVGDEDADADADGEQGGSSDAGDEGEQEDGSGGEGDEQEDSDGAGEEQGDSEEEEEAEEEEEEEDDGGRRFAPSPGGSSE